MASVSERKNKDGSSSWLVQIRVPGAQRLNRCFYDENEARKFAHLEEERARSAVRRRKVPSLREFNREELRHVMRLYAERPQADPRRAAALIKIGELVGKKRLEEVDRDFPEWFVLMLLQTKSMRGDTYAPTTAARYLQQISAACKWRARHHRVDFKPLTVPSAILASGWNDGRDRRLLPSEERALVKTFSTLKADKPRQWRCMLRLAIETAARQSELATAEWNEFDLERRVWNIPKHKTKAKKARWVALSRRAIRVLKVLKAQSAPGCRKVFSLGIPATVSNDFRDLTRASGVVDFHFHDLRHEAISRMFLKRKALQPYEIMRMVGHSSMSMLNRYANLRPEDIVDRMG